ncbi:MAG: TetR family transcriptional regulator [Hyphomonadaceae bacterium]|nr:TetR family transcriptional regulator [Hyphomonadaceae bacterium]
MSIQSEAIGRRKSRVGRPAKAEAAARTKETRDAILDVAEEIFSKHGFHGVTTREVARRAHVNTALIHYYFNTKQELFDAVFLRRAEVINAQRIQAMDDYESKLGDKVTVEGAIEAFLHPVLHVLQTGGPHWRNYFALVGLVNSSTAWGGEVMTRYFDPVIHRLIDLLQRAMPKATREDLYWSYNFLSGSLTLSLAETGRIDRLSDGVCKSTDIPAFEPRMIAYAAAGFRRVCEGKKPL